MTKEELAELNEQMDRVLAARAAIVTHLGGPWKRGMKSAQGAIDCPTCGGVGTLKFSRAGHNGHVHAACTTAGCVNWME